jgi:hypothetical protein
MNKRRFTAEYPGNIVSPYTKKALLILILFVTMLKIGWAQDTIIIKSGVRIVCNIVEVDSVNIRFYTRLSNGTRVKTFIPVERVLEYKYGPKLEKADFWFNAGVGAGIVNGGFGSNNADNFDGPSFGLSYSTRKNKGLISIRFIYNEEMIFFKVSPLENLWDMGVLYGRIARRSYGFASISGGLGLVGGVHRGSFINLSDYTIRYEKHTYNTFGIPFESQLFWTPSPFVGFGIYGFANVNPEKSFFGGLFCIQLGRHH